MRGVRFCANPIYQAIIQFDAVRPREHRHMRWQLQMSYKEDDESVFQLDAEDISPSGQIAVECNPEEINVYITSEKHLLKYAVDLPRSGLESLLGNFF
ncbi:unnamed protein product [Toxocara canis]|uniref:HECT-type E3 ubiquitin transferase E3D n=1 Tax=Toxocara canis TaxID=6265 RepID=A0A183UN85_TOXCA|nr:unnamed protein product [Toxocara canis]